MKYLVSMFWIVMIVVFFNLIMLMIQTEPTVFHTSVFMLSYLGMVFSGLKLVVNMSEKQW